MSEKIEQQFSKHFPVERLSGNKRVKTAIEIAKKVDTKPSELFVSYGFSLADSLAIVPYATEKEIPELLNASQKTLNRLTLKRYIDLKPNQTKKLII